MEWKEVRLGDIADVQTGPFGSQLHKSDYIAEGIPCIMPTNIGPHLNLVVDGIAHVSEVDANRLSRHLTEFGDIIYARRGDIEKCAYVTTNEEKWLCGTGCLKIRCKNEVNSRFIAYLLSTTECKKWITGNAVGTTMLNLSKGILSNLPLIIPSLADQRRIASILSSLDRKIELNNKINADLEEMAQAIFKNWFVDFEPFKDGKFVNSELGMIPEGWKVVTLDDLTSKFGTGLNPRKNFVLGHGNNYYVTIKNMGNNRIYLNDRCDKVDDEALAKINKRSKLQKGDLLFSGIGTIGRVAMVVDDPINWNTSESVFNMHPIDTVSSEFIYLLLLSDKFQQYVQQNAQGGVQQGIRMASLKAFQFAIPNDLNLFDNLVKPIISKVKSNDKENDTLSLLRDTLLPRLMSGEIEVPE